MRRHLTLPVANRMHQVVAEHRLIAGAIEVGDALLAAERMDHHLRQLKTDTLQALERYPSYFIVDLDPSNLK